MPNEIYDDPPEIVNETLEPPTPILPSSKEEFVISWEHIRNKLLEVLSKYPNLISNVRSIITTIIEFKKEKQSIKFLDTALSFLELAKSNSFHSYYSLLNPRLGFTYLIHKNTNIGFLFVSVLDNFPKRVIKFVDGTFITHHQLPIGDLYLYSYNNESYLYYNKNKVKREDLMQFLAEEKLKEFNSNFILYQKNEDQPGYGISSINPKIYHSKFSQQTIEYVKKFINAGHNRSMLFYGQPGSGKSMGAFAILNELGYRTLLFNASNEINSPAIIDYIVEIFKIEAVIIDDFDQFSHSNKKLELLENLNKKLKVVIGIANTLKEFHPALLRPGRFDEVILLNELDRECVVSVLGELAEEHYENVKHWPIAFVQELSKRAQLSDLEDVKKHIQELENRVDKQIKALSS